MSRVAILGPGDKIIQDQLPDHLTTANLAEAARDAVMAMLVSGANITLNKDDAGDTVTITAVGGDAEFMRDTIGAAFVGINGVVVTPNDAADTITVSISGLSISQVTGLQAALDGKAATSHTHTIANVTNLQTTLDGKMGSFTTGMQFGYGTTLPAPGVAGRFFVVVPS